MSKRAFEMTGPGGEALTVEVQTQPLVGEEAEASPDSKGWVAVNVFAYTAETYDLVTENADAFMKKIQSHVRDVAVSEYGEHDEQILVTLQVHFTDWDMLAEELDEDVE